MVVVSIQKCLRWLVDLAEYLTPATMTSFSLHSGFGTTIILDFSGYQWEIGGILKLVKSSVYKLRILRGACLCQPRLGTLLFLNLALRYYLGCYEY